MGAFADERADYLPFRGGGSGGDPPTGVHDRAEVGHALVERVIDATLTRDEEILGIGGFNVLKEDERRR